ncbi:MAG: oligosaccharide flippase family protein, partial [bacterium]
MFRILNQYKGSLAQHSSTYLIAGGLSSGALLLLLPVLTRYLTPAEYGIVAMFQMSLVLFNVFTGLSVGGASSIKYYDKMINLPRYIGSCVQIVLICTTLCLSLVFLFQSSLSDMAGLSAGWLYMAVLISGSGQLIQLRMAQWQVRNASSIFGFFQISQSLINIFLSLLLVVPLSWGVEGRLWGLTLTTLIFSALAFWSLYKSKLLKLTARYDYFLPILSFGVPLIPHVLGLFLLSMIDRAVIKSELGLTEAGIYTVAIQISMALGLLSTAFNA